MGATAKNGLEIEATRAEGTKCERYWNYSPAVGADAEFPTLCERTGSKRNGEFEPTINNKKSKMDMVLNRPGGLAIGLFYENLGNRDALKTHLPEGNMH